MTNFGPNTVGQADTPEREQAARVIANANSRYAAVRTRTDLSDLGKSANIAAMHLRTKAKLTGLAQSEKDRRASDRKDAETTLYGLPRQPLSGADAISQRDAADRAAALSTPTSAATLLDRAQRSGDVHLASAVAQRAAQSGWREVLKQYVGDDAGKREALDTINTHNATVDTPQDKMTADMIFRSGTPPEVKGLSQAKLQELADQAGTTA
jgi:hypothetical protein